MSVSFHHVWMSKVNYEITPPNAGKYMQRNILCKCCKQFSIKLTSDHFTPLLIQSKYFIRALWYQVDDFDFGRRHISMSSLEEMRKDIGNATINNFINFHLQVLQMSEFLTCNKCEQFFSRCLLNGYTGVWNDFDTFMFSYMYKFPVPDEIYFNGRIDVNGAVNCYIRRYDLDNGRLVTSSEAQSNTVWPTGIPNVIGVDFGGAVGSVRINVFTKSNISKYVIKPVIDSLSFAKILYEGIINVTTGTSHTNKHDRQFRVSPEFDSFVRSVAIDVENFMLNAFTKIPFMCAICGSVYDSFPAEDVYMAHHAVCFAAKNTNTLAQLIASQ